MTGKAMQPTSEQKQEVICDLRVLAGNRPYTITVGRNLHSQCAAFLGRYPQGAVVTNETICGLYGTLAASIRAGIPDCGLLVIGDGERFKNLDTLGRIYRELQSLGIGRDGVLVALGGGVVGDLAGFAAATYLRGIDYVQVPTTLLAMVDSGVGGKTGINLPEGKNMVGAFHQPRAVFSDLGFLKTLADREIAAAMAEIIKYGLIRDREFYDYIRKNREAIKNRSRSHMGRLIERCCRFKADIVARDEREQGLRGILNFGHTLGHALEAYTRYETYLHGEAVALGSLAMVRYAADKGRVERSFVNDLSSLLAFFGLPTKIPRDFKMKDIMSYLISDKKRRRGVNQWVTLRGIGDPHITEEVEISEISAALKGLKA